MTHAVFMDVSNYQLDVAGAAVAASNVLFPSDCPNYTKGSRAAVTSLALQPSCGAIEQRRCPAASGHRSPAAPCRSDTSAVKGTSAGLPAGLV